MSEPHGRRKHPLAAGLFAGAAAGGALALLFAPHRGSETRHQIGDGCRRAGGAIGRWADRGNQAFRTTRTKVADGARGTTRYVRDVTDAVTMRTRRESGPAFTAPRTVPVGQSR